MPMTRITRTIMCLPLKASIRTVTAMKP